MAALGLTPALGTAAGPEKPLSVARWMGALQAQDYSSGVWSIGVRSGLTLAEIERAVADRQIVRTWPMRGTIHWVPAEDARWMCELLAARVIASLGTRYAQLGITQDEIDKAGVLFEEHLAFCSWCVTYVEQMRETVRATGTLREEDLDPALRDSLLTVFRDWKES